MGISKGRDVVGSEQLVLVPVDPGVCPGRGKGRRGEEGGNNLHRVLVRSFRYVRMRVSFTGGECSCSIDFYQASVSML